MAIVPRDIDVPMSELALVASAINIQVNRDLAKPWNIQANVAAFPDDAEPLARGFVPLYIVADAGGSDGIHKHPDNGSLFALVRYAPHARWSLAASHEVLELLVDPTLHYFLPGALLEQPSVTVQYLVEICDPCEGPDCAYVVDDAHGIYVSDFCLPSYYRSPSPSGPYSFQDNLIGPGTVADGGRVTWRDAAGFFSQRTRVGGPERVIGNLTEPQIFGDTADRSNVRGAIDRATFHGRPRARRLRKLAPKQGRTLKRKTSKAVADMDKVLRRLIATGE